MLTDEDELHFKMLSTELNRHEHIKYLGRIFLQSSQMVWLAYNFF